MQINNTIYNMPVRHFSDHYLLLRGTTVWKYLHTKKNIFMIFAMS